ncbi:MAG: amino acid deaminase/aldolase [Streptosporangiales bacterium]|jgi:D-serine deaminase-like pyridoxal phosphate-dependent protein|nr:amino acid deaminase/aldolase [Streptosporangiales bacterium]
MLSADPAVSEALERWDSATRTLDPPFAVVDLDAFDANARDLVRRGNGVPIRVVTKSLRCRHLIERVLKRPGYRGIMCYSLPEALWLHETGVSDDILVAYPTANQTALRALAADPRAREHITITVDSTAHLDFVDETLGDDHPDIRLSLELDVSWRPLSCLPPVGTLRSPLHEPAQAAQFAEEVLKRPGFRLVGVMGYEGQIAGLGDAPSGHPLRSALLRVVQACSARELAARRAETVRRIRELTDLEFVNGGGTGSLETTSSDDSVTELAAGSGLVGPGLFDAYHRFRPQPALMFALPVVRRPGPGIATLFSGGFVASGTGTPDRLPLPFLPGGLRLTRTEGAGEVQTPVLGGPAGGLRIGDRVWMRHAKGGELAERFAEYHLFSGGAAPESVPTYRGEGRCFG